MTPRCESCGTSWRKHLGIQGTCAKLREAERELERLQSIVDRCQVNADGDVVCVGGWQWVECDSGPIREKVCEIASGVIRGGARWPLSRCHSTREAAEKARAT
jgi:hypothetical protein